MKPATIAAAAAIVLLLVSAPVSCSQPRLKSIMVDPVTIKIYHDYSKEIFVTAVYTRGPNKDVTNNCTYSSSSTNVASVNSAGLVYGENPGTANVTVSYTEANVTQTAIVPVTIVEVGGTDNYSGVS